MKETVPATPDKKSSPAVIEVSDFRAAYGDKTVVEKLTFDIRRGEIFVIGGGSGCGKSTVLKHIIGLYEPAAGKILIEGDDLSKASGDLRKKILRKFGVAFQGGALFGNMTVLENVRLPMEEFTDLADDQMNMIALAKLKLVNLEEAACKRPSELSGGMQKRAAIARSISLDPSIVFLDEPSAGLDPITSADLDQLILDLNNLLGMTFVVVTHELPSIFTIADRVLMLDAATKTMAALGPPEELRDNSPSERVRAFFNRVPTRQPTPNNGPSQNQGAKT